MSNMELTCLSFKQIHRQEAKREKHSDTQVKYAAPSWNIFIDFTVTTLRVQAIFTDYTYIIYI